MDIKLSKGLDIPMRGAPAPLIEPGAAVTSVALSGTDYCGLKPKMLVAVGDQVKLGQPLFIDKRDPEVQFTSPGNGTISAINRGARRALRSVVIALEESTAVSEQYVEPAAAKADGYTQQQVQEALYRSGLWTAFRTRPFNKVPQSGSTPHSIFITAIDTRPLAGNPETVVAKYQDAFLQGLDIVALLTDGKVHVCTDAEWRLPITENEQLQHNRFSGPHPAGLPSTHIHHLDPVSTDRTVWHIDCQDVIAIGKLFHEGMLWTERTIALGGAGFAQPRMLSTRLGANLAELTSHEFAPNLAHPQRIISGSVLAGRTVTNEDAYLGRYHLQVCALDDTSKRKLFGWLGLFDGSYSFASRLARRQSQKTLHDFSTAQFGRPTALLAIDAFDRVIPMDILTVPLLRALLIRDTDQAQDLGCLELDSEDLALCSFVCPGKNDYGTALKLNLEQIERDG